MKSIRERFVKNHRKEVQYAPNKKGYKNVLIYTGDFYTWEPEKINFSGIRKLFAALEAVTVILFGLSSIPGTEISYSPFVVSAAILSFAVWFFELYGLVSFCFRRLPLEEDDYSYIRKVFPVTFTARAVLLIFAAIMGFITVAQKGPETASILSCIGYLVTAAISVFLFLTYLKLRKHVVIIPNTDKPAEK